MARTKQTARKNTGGKPLAMAKKKNTAPQPKKPGKTDRKVIIEYSSDEEPQQEGATSRKKVKKQVHLTLPTSPTHVTTTESFKTFFINHGLTKALQKAFEQRGWSTDQMQELRTNFQDKYGQPIPLPKIYGDEDTSEDEGLQLGDGTTVGKKTPGGGGKGGSKGGRKGGDKGPTPGTSRGDGGSGGAGDLVILAVLADLAVLAVLAILVVLVVLALVELAELVVQEGSEQANEVGMTMMTEMTPANAERQGEMGRHPDSRQPVRSHVSRVPPTLQSTEICPFSTSPVTRRGQS